MGEALYMGMWFSLFMLLKLKENVRSVGQIWVLIGFEKAPKQNGILREGQTGRTEILDIWIWHTCCGFMGHSIEVIYSTLI